MVEYSLIKGYYKAFLENSRLLRKMGRFEIDHFEKGSFRKPVTFKSITTKRRYFEKFSLRKPVPSKSITSKKGHLEKCVTSKSIIMAKGHFEKGQLWEVCHCKIDHFGKKLLQKELIFELIDFQVAHLQSDPCLEWSWAI